MAKNKEAIAVRPRERTVDVTVVSKSEDPRISRMRAQVERVCQRNAGLVIKDQKTYDLAVEDRRVLSDMLESINELFEPMRESTYNAYKTVLAQKGALYDPVNEALKARNRTIGAWDTEQRRLEQQKATALLEKETQRAAKQREKEIARAKKKGDTTTVRALQDAPLDVGPVKTESTYERSSEISTRTTWSCEVTDFMALIKFVSENKHFFNLLEPNTSELNRLARAQKSALSIPGLKAVPNTGVAKNSR